MTIYKTILNTNQNTKNSMSKNHQFCRYYAGWNCQNQQGQQRHKITLFANS